MAEGMIQQWRFRFERVEIVSGAIVEIPFGFGIDSIDGWIR